ncbi:type VII secretion system-associated protein [Actinokineospora pegani]|uniref:type VII secretion system-associated protein n=1 Tax=Actinokineospora pegani TaxID=2654637 RepID=UPI001F25B332|nr:type VII secretion system-associated protein [Actinokineospora pegani]
MTSAPEPETDGLLLLIDIAWESTDAEPDPPVSAVLGAWPVTDGVRGGFQPNPVYTPSSPDSPLDPVDAVLRAAARGESADELPVLLRDAVLGVAVDEEGDVLVGAAPDGVPSVLVTTAAGHRAPVDAAGWLRVDVRWLAEALPERGIDVVLNLGGPAAMRVPAEVVRSIAAVAPAG